MTCCSMGLPARSSSPLSPPPMRRDCPPARITPVTSELPVTVGPLEVTRASSVHGLGVAAFAGVLSILVCGVRCVRVEDDAFGAGEGDEALSSGTADEREASFAGEIDAPGREARARDEHRDAHLHGLDHHLRSEAAGGVEDLVV